MPEPFFSNNLGQQLKVLNILFEKDMNNGLKQLGITLTGTQTAVLMQLADRHPQQLTQKEVETTLRLSHPTTRGIVKRLAATGLIDLPTKQGHNKQRQHFANVRRQQILQRFLNVGKHFSTLFNRHDDC